MSKFLPIQSLIRISIALAVIIGLLAFAFLYIANVEIKNATALCLMGAAIVCLIGIADIYILGLTKAHPIASRRKRKWKRYLLSYLASPLIYGLVWMAFSPFTGNPAFMWLKMPLHFILVISSWLGNTLILLLYDFSYANYSKAQAEIENLELKASLSETAMIILKQQIHPHFLFNVLTTIKSLYKIDAQQGETYLVHLANFLRASITNQTVKLARLADEVLLCEDYIKMQQIRFGTALNYSIDISAPTIKHGFVPYFALQTLLENAIKHNDLTEQAPLCLTIKEEEGYIRVANNLQPKKFKEPSTGLGLANLAERYRLLAEEEIFIRQEEQFFSVSIKILNP